MPPYTTVPERTATNPWIKMVRSITTYKNRMSFNVRPKEAIREIFRPRNRSTEVLRKKPRFSASSWNGSSSSSWLYGLCGSWYCWFSDSTLGDLEWPHNDDEFRSVPWPESLDHREKLGSCASCTRWYCAMAADDTGCAT